MIQACEDTCSFKVGLTEDEGGRKASPIDEGGIDRHELAK